MNQGQAKKSSRGRFAASLVLPAAVALFFVIGSTPCFAGMFDDTLKKVTGGAAEETQAEATDEAEEAATPAAEASEASDAGQGSQVGDTLKAAATAGASTTVESAAAGTEIGTATKQGAAAAVNTMVAVPQGDAAAPSVPDAGEAVGAAKDQATGAATEAATTATEKGAAAAGDAVGNWTRELPGSGSGSADE
jgi:hypothetical protein